LTFRAIWPKCSYILQLLPITRALAAYYDREALVLLTLSDHIVKGEQLSAEDRQTSFREMMEVALSPA
jgi:purine-nucleoside phosphorylase